jgi:hypothetical protein
VSLSGQDVPGGVRVRASATDATGPGHELAGEVALTLDYSYDGQTFHPLTPPGAGPVDFGYTATPQRPLWIRAGACDANRNCASRSAGPFTGAPGGAAGGPPPAPAPARRPAARPRGAIMALGLGGPCRARGPRCLRVVWRARPAALGGVRYRLDVRQQRTGRLLARARGSARAGTRQAIALVPRRPVACGRVVARLTLRSRAGTRTVVRRAAIRRGCVRVTAPVPRRGASPAATGRSR